MSEANVAERENVDFSMQNIVAYSLAGPTYNKQGRGFAQLVVRNSYQIEIDSALPFCARFAGHIIDHKNKTQIKPDMKPEVRSRVHASSIEYFRGMKLALGDILVPTICWPHPGHYNEASQYRWRNIEVSPDFGVYALSASSIEIWANSFTEMEIDVTDWTAEKIGVRWFDSGVQVGLLKISTKKPQTITMNPSEISRVRLTGPFHAVIKPSKIKGCDLRWFSGVASLTIDVSHLKDSLLCICETSVKNGPLAASKNVGQLIVIANSGQLIRSDVRHTVM